MEGHNELPRPHSEAFLLFGGGAGECSGVKVPSDTMERHTHILLVCFVRVTKAGIVIPKVSTRRQDGATHEEPGRGLHAGLGQESEKQPAWREVLNLV